MPADFQPSGTGRDPYTGAPLDPGSLTRPIGPGVPMDFTHMTPDQAAYVNWLGNGGDRLGYDMYGNAIPKGFMDTYMPYITMAGTVAAFAPGLLGGAGDWTAAGTGANGGLAGAGGGLYDTGGLLADNSYLGGVSDVGYVGSGLGTGTGLGAGAGAAGAATLPEVIATAPAIGAGTGLGTGLGTAAGVGAAGLGINALANGGWGNTLTNAQNNLASGSSSNPNNIGKYGAAGGGGSSMVGQGLGNGTGLTSTVTPALSSGGASGMGWTDWLNLASNIYSGVSSANAQSKAADAQNAANNAAIQAQLQMYNTTRNDNAPYRYIGNEALNSLANANGLNQYNGNVGAPATNSLTSNAGNWTNGLPLPGGKTLVGGSSTPSGTTNASFPGQAPGNFGTFQASPGYNFVRSEGQRGLEQTAAARGGAFSGNALRALSDYNQNIASKEYDNWYSRMSQLAGYGPSATNAVSSAGQNAVNNQANLLNANGYANASGIVGGQNAINNMVNQAAGWLKNYSLNG